MINDQQNDSLARLIGFTEELCLESTKLKLKLKIGANQIKVFVLLSKVGKVSFNSIFKVIALFRANYLVKYFFSIKI